MRAAIRTVHSKKPIDVGISRSGFEAIVRNLRGPTRRQAARVIRDTVVENQEFRDDDLNVIIAPKRRMIQRGGLLVRPDPPDPRRDRGRQPDQFDQDALAGASEGYSGSESEQAIVPGLYAAFAQDRPLETDQVLAALRRSPPLSVTSAERVQALRDWAQGRCVSAD